MTIEAVGVRRFREDLAHYIDSEAPVAVTRHGETVGVYIPARANREADMAVLRRASERLNQLIDFDDQMDEILTEFKELRRADKVTA